MWACVPGAGRVRKGCLIPPEPFGCWEMNMGPPARVGRAANSEPFLQPMVTHSVHVCTCVLPDQIVVASENKCFTLLSLPVLALGSATPSLGPQ